METKEYSSKQILNIYSSDKSSIMRSLLAKVRVVTNEVKFYVSSGWDVKKASLFCVEEFSFMFEVGESDLFVEWCIKNIK